MDILHRKKIEAKDDSRAVYGVVLESKPTKRTITVLPKIAQNILPENPRFQQVMDYCLKYRIDLPYVQYMLIIEERAPTSFEVLSVGVSCTLEPYQQGTNSFFLPLLNSNPNGVICLGKDREHYSSVDEAIKGTIDKIWSSIFNNDMPVFLRPDEMVKEGWYNEHIFSPISALSELDIKREPLT